MKSFIYFINTNLELIFVLSPLIIILCALIGFEVYYDNRQFEQVKFLIDKGMPPAQAVCQVNKNCFVVNNCDEGKK